MMELTIKIKAAAEREVQAALHEVTQRLSYGWPDYEDRGEGWSFFYELDEAEQHGEQLCSSPWGHDECDHD